MREGVRFLLGAGAVYLVVAACSEGELRRALSDAGETMLRAIDAGSTELEGETQSPREPDPSPVPEAAAQPSEEPTIVEADCECEPTGDESFSSCLAVASFPGRSVIDLARLVVVTEIRGGSMPPGYTHSLAANALLKDGEAAAYCGISTEPQGPVRFVLP